MWTHWPNSNTTAAPTTYPSSPAVAPEPETQLAATIHDHHQITVHVTNGVATLTGTLTWHSTAERAHHIARSIPGVITTRNNLTYHVDDMSFTGL